MPRCTTNTTSLAEPDHMDFPNLVTEILRSETVRARATVNLPERRDARMSQKVALLIVTS